MKLNLEPHEVIAETEFYSSSRHTWIAEVLSLNEKEETSNMTTLISIQNFSSQKNYKLPLTEAAGQDQILVRTKQILLHVSKKKEETFFLAILNSPALSCL